MHCGCQQPVEMAHQSHHCCCGGHQSLRAGFGSGMWSKKKKIRILEEKLQVLNEQKSDLQELIDELKEKR